VTTYGVLLAFFVSWTYAGSNVLSRKLKNVHFSVLCFYHPIVGTTIAVAIMLVNFILTGATPGIYSAEIYGYLGLCCACDFININSTNIAFQNDSSGFIAIIGYMSMVYGFLADEFIFHLPITGYDLLGAVLIAVVTLTTTVHKVYQSSQQKTKEMSPQK